MNINTGTLYPWHGCVCKLPLLQLLSAAGDCLQLYSCMYCMLTWPCH